MVVSLPGITSTELRNVALLVEMEDFPSEDYSTIFSNSDGDMVATSRRFRMGMVMHQVTEVIGIFGPMIC